MATTDRFDASQGDVRRVMFWLWIAGLASMVLLLAGIVFPLLLSLATELLLGAVLGALGAVQIIRALFSGDVVSRSWTLLFGAVALAGGALLLLCPLEGMLTLTALLATFFLAGGVVKLIGAWEMGPVRMRELGLGDVPGRGWMALSCTLSLVLGLLLILGLPSTAAWALSLLLGIDLLFLGLSEIALAMGLDRIRGREATA